MTIDDIRVIETKPAGRPAPSWFVPLAGILIGALYVYVVAQLVGWTL